METKAASLHDVCIVGAGPAGLNAALLLGRCRRDVVVIDSGKPRNGPSRALHGFLSRDGIGPLELRELGRRELARYPTVSLREEVEVTGGRRRDDGFELTIGDGTVLAARFLLLATGRVDIVPAKPGFREYYGRGIYHCPYCDGWEHRDQRLIAYGRGEPVFDIALELLCWSRTVTICSDGGCDLGVAQREKLQANGIGVVEAEVLEAHGGEGGGLTEIVVQGGEAIPCDALFFPTDCLQRSALAESLGCELDDTGSVACDGHAATRVPHLYVAGNVRGGVHLAIVAAAEGAEAGMAINEALHELNLR